MRSDRPSSRTDENADVRERPTRAREKKEERARDSTDERSRLDHRYAPTSYRPRASRNPTAASQRREATERPFQEHRSGDHASGSAMATRRSKVERGPGHRQVRSAAPARSSYEVKYVRDSHPYPSWTPRAASSHPPSPGQREHRARSDRAASRKSTRSRSRARGRSRPCRSSRGYAMQSPVRTGSPCEPGGPTGVHEASSRLCSGASRSRPPRTATRGCASDAR